MAEFAAPSPKQAPKRRRKGRRVMQQMFATTEVFEAILLHLPPQDILLVQRVHSHFRNVIKSSPAIQQKLFFAPVPETPGRTPELNPLLSALFPPFFALNKPIDPADLHSLRSIYRLDWFDDPFYRERILRPDASWRLMYPVQPPAKLDMINIYSYDSCVICRFPRVRAKLGDEYEKLQGTGMRMDLLFDLVTLLDSNHEFPAFFVHWQMFPLRPARPDLGNPFQGKEGSGLGQVADWKDGNPAEYGPLISNEQDTLQNTITIHYNHDSLCGGGVSEVSLLTIESAFTESVKSQPTSLFHFLDCPGTYATCWGNYIALERLKELRKKQRNRR